MNEDNIQRGFKKVISFIAFTIGILSITIGCSLIGISIINGSPFVFEGSTAIMLGAILMYIVDQSILNTKRHDMLKHMIKENNILSQRQKGNGGILGSILSGMNPGKGNMDMDIKIVPLSEEHLKDMNESLFSNEPVNPNFDSDVKKIMLRTSLNEEDAQELLLLEDSSLKEMSKKKNQFTSEERYELVVFVENMIDSKKKSEDNS